MSGIHLLQLPPEILAQIFINLDLQDIRNVMFCSKFLLNIIITNNRLWKSICKNQIIVRSSSDNRKPITLSYYNQYRISNNWCSGIYRNKAIVQHRVNYMPWLIFYASEALLLSVGSELKCFATDKRGVPVCKESWKLEFPLVKRNDIRTNDISRFVVKDNLILCGNRDGNATIYKFNHISQKPTYLCCIRDCIENGLVEVSTVELITGFENCYILTGSMYSSNLAHWKYEIDENNSKIACHYYSVLDLSDEVGIRSLSVHKDKVAIGPNGNSKPLLFDMNTHQLIISADVTTKARQLVRDIRWHDENTLLYVTHAGKLSMADIRSSTVVYNAMDPFQSSMYCVKSDGDRTIIVGTAENSRCVFFDVRNNTCQTQMYFTQKRSSPIYSLDFDSTKLIAAADRNVTLLNFNVNASSTFQRDYSQKFHIF